MEAAALPATTRIRALEGVLAEAVQSIGRLSSRVTALEDLPKRLEALEQATPPEKLVTALAKRVDRLSTQTAATKDLPGRVASLEQQVPDASRIEERALAEVGAVVAEVESLSAGVDTVSGELAALRRLLEETVPRLGELEVAHAAVAEVVPPPDRTEALVSGLGHAVDMIDQLSHQVAVLEQALGAGQRGR
jgi:chromosome segregation ATPase